MITTSQPGIDEVHVYRIVLSQQFHALPRLRHYLSQPETDRAVLLQDDLAKKRFSAGRGVLREILGGYIGIEAEQVRIATGEYGKPYLAEYAGNIRFNLSHSEDVMILAVTTGRDVGVDIETLQADKPVHSMARLAFSPHEQEELLTLPSSQLQASAFYRCWVRKEACLKACGRGFSLPGSSFDVPVCVEKLPQQTLITCAQSLCYVQDIDVPENYCAALAIAAGADLRTHLKLLSCNLNQAKLKWPYFE
ncbi:MAG TPA: 4'-phosphopantetheinyl transferase superfamily protein [Desulfuromonadales bacterium]|nr:4'-phosphopantetheinyl transferase superfamily protein [Desulfuromonadales bacterium]